MSEEDLKSEIAILEKKIKEYENKLAPIKQAQEEVLEEITEKYKLGNVSVKIVDRKIANLEINLKRWKSDMEIYKRVLHNKKMNTQMFES